MRFAPRDRGGTRRQALSRGTWGWTPGKTAWVPPQYAGVHAEIDLLGTWTPNPVQVPVVMDDDVLHKHAAANRRGGKTNAMGAASTRRTYQRARALIAGEDPHPAWGPGAFDTWFRETVGPPGSPAEVSSGRLLRRWRWPIPCVGGAPESALCDLQRAELASHWDRFEDELGVAWLDGGLALVVLGLGIKWQFQSFDRARTKVGSGLCHLWVTEAARCKSDVWEHVLPSLTDRRGSLYTDTTPWGGRDPDGYWGQCVATSCPSEAALAGTELDPESRYYHWLPPDNYAVPGLAEAMRRDVKKFGPRSAYVLRTWLASWDTPEGACWPEFDRSIHMRRVTPGAYEMFVAGYDHGFAESAACCLVCGVTGHRPRKVHVLAALYGTGIFVVPVSQGEDFAASNTVAGFLARTLRMIRKDYPGAKIMGYGAPERTESWQALNRQPGMTWQKAQHVSGAGIEAVGHALSSGRLTFDTGLPREVFRDIEGARWAKDANGRPLPMFDKAAIDPHAGEALVYALGAISNVLDLTSPALTRGRVF